MDQSARTVTEAALRRNLTPASAEFDIMANKDAEEAEQALSTVLGRIETAPNMASVQELARRARQSKTVADVDDAKTFRFEGPDSEQGIFARFSSFGSNAPTWRDGLFAF